MGEMSKSFVGWACVIFSTDFSSILLVHSFVRFLSELCVCDIVSCFVLSKWVDGLYEIWAKCQRHLWAGFVSFLSTDFSSRASSQVVARHSKNILNL